MANKPVHRISVREVRCSIWVNQTKREPMATATFERRYKVGDEFKSSSSFAVGELLALRTAVEQAITWMLQHTPSSLGQLADAQAEALKVETPEEAAEFEPL